jgi:hypothetical protein
MRNLLILFGAIALVILIASPVLAISSPSIETRFATFITVTTARLNAYVLDDGGEDCEVMFQYYYGDGDWADNETPWVAGYVTSDQAYVDVTSLTTDELYCYRAVIKNGSGTIDGDSVTFSAYAAPEMPSKWFGTPDVDKFKHAFFYGLFNYIADLIKMPQDVFYMLATLLTCIILGIAALIIGKRLMPSVIVLCGAMALASLLGLLPMFFIAFSIIGIFGMIKMGHPREE